MTTDLSLNTLVISAVIALVGWGLKGVMVFLGETCKKLIEALWKTMAKVEVLDSKITDLIQTVGDVQKMKGDVNGLYTELKALKLKYESHS